MDALFNLLRWPHEVRGDEHSLHNVQQKDIAEVIDGLGGRLDSRADMKQWKRKIRSNGNIMLSEMVLTTFDDESLDIKAGKLLEEFKASCGRVQHLRGNSDQGEIFIDAKEHQETPMSEDERDQHVEGVDGSEKRTESLCTGRIDEDRIEKERVEKERIEKERIEKERIEKERIEKDRLEKERIEKDRLEKERIEKDRLEKERIEKDRLEKERFEKDKSKEIEKQKVEDMRFDQQRLERERLEKERAAEERKKQELSEQEVNARERDENKRIEQDKVRFEKKKPDLEAIAKKRLEDQSPEEKKKGKEEVEEKRFGTELLSQKSRNKESTENVIKRRIEQRRIQREKMRQRSQVNESAEKRELGKNQQEQRGGNDMISTLNKQKNENSIEERTEENRIQEFGKEKIDGEGIDNSAVEKIRMEKKSSEDRNQGEELIPKVSEPIAQMIKVAVEERRTEMEIFDKKRRGKLNKEQLQSERGEIEIEEEAAKKTDDEKDQGKHSQERLVSDSIQKKQGDQSVKKTDRRFDWLEQGQALEEKQSSMVKARLEMKRKVQLQNDRRDDREKQSAMDDIFRLRKARLERERATKEPSNENGNRTVQDLLSELIACGMFLIEFCNKEKETPIAREAETEASGKKDPQLYMYDAMMRLFSGLIIEFDVAVNEVNLIAARYIALMINVYSDVRIADKVAHLTKLVDSRAWEGTLRSDMDWIVTLARMERDNVERNVPIVDHISKTPFINVCEKDVKILSFYKKQLSILMTSRTNIELSVKQFIKDSDRANSDLERQLYEVEMKLKRDALTASEATRLGMAKVSIMERQLELSIRHQSMVRERHLIDKKIIEITAEVGIKVNPVHEGIDNVEETLKGLRSQLSRVQDQKRLLLEKSASPQQPTLSNEGKKQMMTEKKEAEARKNSLMIETIRRENELKMKRIAEQEAEIRKRAIERKRKMQNRNVVRSDMDPRLKRMKR